VPANDVSGLMDALGFPPELHADAAALIAEIARRLGGDVDPTVAAFLGRSLHGVELQKNGRDPFVTFNAQLVADWSWESSAGEGLDALIAFADDTSDRVFLLDPTDSLGFGAAAVHSIEKGSGLLEDLVLVARSLSDFLSIYAGDARPVGRRVFDLRDEQTAAHPPPPRLGGGTELPADAVSDPRFFPKLDILRSVNLTQPLLLAGVTYLPDLDRTGRRRQPDLRFFRSGRVARGLVAGGSLGGFAVAANSRVSWSAAGELVGFLPAEVAIVRGIPCRPGTPVVAIGPTLTVTPDVDVEHRGFPCKAGTQIEDYGTVISFTAARAFQYAGRTIPDGVRVQTTDDGGVRFDLIADFVIDGRTLHAGTHVWYEADGAIRQIDARDGR
jgi:hypothetical protein